MVCELEGLRQNRYQPLTQNRQQPILGCQSLPMVLGVERPSTLHSGMTVILGLNRVSWVESEVLEHRLAQREVLDRQFPKGSCVARIANLATNHKKVVRSS